MRLRVLIILLLAGQTAWANEAGQVLFVAGTVTAEREEVVALKKADPIFEKDAIVTAARSRAQLLMRDNAKLALRPGTRIVIDEYFLAGDEREQPDGSVVVESSDSAVTSLVKGGFRTITGAIGQAETDAYTVVTPAATMGIRGTHYSVVWCAGDCVVPPGVDPEPIPDGLYLGVADGVVVLTNLTGEYLVNAGEFVYVKDRNTPPVRLPKRPAVLIDTYQTDPAFPEDAAFQIEETIAALGRGDDLGVPAFRGKAPPPTGPDFGGLELQDGTIAGFEAELETPIDLVDVGPITDGQLPVTFPVTIASGPIVGVGLTAFTDASVFGTRAFASNDLTAFELNDASYDIGTALILEDGFDAVSGIGWGRWSNGVAGVIRADGSSAGVDLAQQSLHWVYGPAPDFDFSVPTTGTANYTLIVGDTDPTDTMGNTGLLGNASLLANFTTATVNSDLLLVIGGRDWQASGSGSITNSFFSGLYDTVLIGGQPDGSGNFSGFFGAPGTSGFPSAVGLTYGLTDIGGVSVSGAVIFGEPMAP